MSKLPTGGYQPTNRPKNLTLPNKGPSYKPKEKKTKVIWHPYPQEKPSKEKIYLVTVVDKVPFVVEAKYFSEKKKFSDVHMGDFFDECVTAWAEKPEPYEDMKNV